MGDVVQFRPRGNDDQLESLIEAIRLEDRSHLFTIINELQETVKQTANANEPENFAYGKLVKMLDAEDDDDLLHLAAAAIWSIRNGIL